MPDRTCPTMKSQAQWFITMAVVFLLAAGRVWADIGGDFTLTRTDGDDFALHDLQGQVVVLSFGYTSCPDVCPTTLGYISSMMGALGPLADQVVPVFISVDPQRDTPTVLRDYLSYFHDSIVGLTGTEAQLQRVAKQYGTFYRYQGRRGTGPYEVDHSGNIYVIGRDGRLSRIIPYGMPPAQLIESVRDVLNEPDGAAGR